MKRITTIVFIIFFVTQINAQNATDRDLIISQTNVEKLNEISENHLKIQAQFKHKEVARILIDKEGNKQFFSHFDQAGSPVYYALENESAAISSKIDLIHAGGSAGLDLDGSGLEFGLWDSGPPRVTHQELIGRVTITDTVTPTFHATHVAGILAATGIVPRAKGMAPSSTINSFTSSDWLSEVALWAAEGGMISNHSYIIANPQSDYEKFGIYNEHSQNWDALSYNAPYLMMVTGASNNGNNNFNPDNSRYDLLASNKLGKNAIVVGACLDVLNYTGPASVRQAAFTSWGPTDDWRIKPDISAVGVNSYSTREANDTDYATGNGSSFASPVVGGGLALLQQHYHNINGVYMKATTAKALILSTTDEAGANDGPDFSNGWGLFNAKNAADVISNNGTLAQISELTLNQDETYELKIVSDGTEPMTVAINWNDPPSEPLDSQFHNDPTLMLINDLDVRIASDSTEYFPWIMEPNADYNNYTVAASKGDNFRDNTEIINVKNIDAGEYTLTVSHKGTLQTSSQDFSLIINGIQTDFSSTAANNEEENIVVYPNPVDNLLKIDLGIEMFKNLKVSIYDLSGQKQISADYTNQNIVELDVSSLSSGTFFLKVQDGQGKLISTKKVIVH